MSGNQVVFNDNTSNNMKEIDIDVWVSNPTVLLDKNTLFEIWPTQQMCYERKINAMSRLIIILTILGFILTRSMKIVVVGFITLIVIYLFYYQNWYKYNRNNKEGFNSRDDSSSGYIPIVNVNVNNSDAESVNQSSNTNTNPTTTTNSTSNQDGIPLKKFIKKNYYQNTKTNPFANVLLTDILDTPDRPSAPPGFEPSVSSDVTKNVKKMVGHVNPGIKCLETQIFSNLYDKFDLDQSNRAFYSTANTKIPNDQGAFAHWLYNPMKYSAKENTPEGAIARVQDNYRWTEP